MNPPAENPIVIARPGAVPCSRATAWTSAASSAVSPAWRDWLAGSNQFQHRFTLSQRLCAG